jgi:predicted amidohydrolase YtcJ
VALMARAWQHGLEPAVHAIGDHANSIALAAFERVGCPGRIEHAQLVRPDDAHRFARPGLVTSVQPQHAVADRDVADRHWSGRTAWAFPYAQLLDAGARLELGSDAPVAEPDPWQAIADAVARTDDDRPPWHPEQAIPLSAALLAASGGRRRVSVGDRADVVVAAEDPANLTPRDLRDMPVLATLQGGRFTFRGDD